MERKLNLKHKTAEDIAIAVRNELTRRKNKSIPALTVLAELFQTLFFASLKTEEGQPINSYIVYINPSNPDPNPPQRIVKDRWSYIPFAEKLQFNVSNLVKVAKASDPRTSSFAVYHDHRQQLYIWGLVDQGNRYHDFINFESETGPERPGIFQASIVGVGHLIAYHGYDRIAELNVNNLVTESHDVLRYGPVRKLLSSGINRYLNMVGHEVGADYSEDFAESRKELESAWVTTLCRLLLRMRGFRHGGALLLAPENTQSGLDLKYKLRYPRLRDALVHRGVQQIVRESAQNSIFGILEDDSAEDIPIFLHLDESIANDELTDSNSELDGAVWFVSLLSRVDGLVLLNYDLEVQGFGVEILSQNQPPQIYLSTTASASARSLRPVDYQHFGTRHRSMIRYCYHVPGSLGFVVSQDGDVRVMTRIGDALVLWDSVRLQYDEFVQQRRKRDAIEKLKRDVAQQRTAPDPAVR